MTTGQKNRWCVKKLEARRSSIHLLNIFIEGLLCQQGEYGSEQDKVLALVELTLLWRKQKANDTQIKTESIKSRHFIK